MITKVSLGFAKLPDTELANFAQAVITAMNGNAGLSVATRQFARCAGSQEPIRSVS